MKQPSQLPFFDKNGREWLAQFDCVTILATIFGFFDSTSVYIVDSKQQILYWGAGMENLTGLASSEVIGQPCSKLYKISEKTAAQDSVLKISHSNGKVTDVIKKVQVLIGNKGEFAGGIGLLVLSTNSSAIISKPRLTDQQNFHGIISRSPAMQDVFHIIQNAAETEATVLVRGESGAGKELVANAIHTLSARHNAPFLAINCAALSSNLLESELFGHVRGAFTGAVKDHSGLFQRANGGTLFLDEVAEMPLDLQAKLLRVLQERSYLPVGGNKTISVDVRIVAATHRSLREEVKNGQFREDLMYRLRVVPIFLPPLRERREDISLLIWHFINHHNNPLVRVIEKIDPDAMRMMLDYRWPGNVRELHNVVEYAFAVGRGAVLRLSELPPEFREQRARSTEVLIESAKPGRIIKKDVDDVAIRQALEQCRGRAGEAADLLGISRATFWRRRKQLGL